MQAFYHSQAQGSLAVEHLGYAPAGTDIGLKIAGGESLLLHTKFNRLHRIRLTNGVILVLIGFD